MSILPDIVQVGHRPSNEGLSLKQETVSQMMDIFSSSNLYKF